MNDDLIRYDQRCTLPDRLGGLECWADPLIDCATANIEIETKRGSRNNMKKKILWHIGFRKTGTTSVQYFLAHLPTDRLPDLLISPRDRLTGKWRGHIIKSTRRKTRPNFTDLQDEIARVAAKLRNVPQNTILISDENLFAFSLFSHNGSHFFDWATEVLPMIEDKFSDFENVFVAYVRPWENWLKSCYSQEVRRGRTSRSYKSWRKQVPASCNWTDGINTIRSAIKSPIFLLSQDVEMEARLPLGTQILDLAGVPRSIVVEFGSVPRLNESLSPMMILLFRLFNLFGLNTVIAGIVDRRLRAQKRLPRRVGEQLAE